MGWSQSRNDYSISCPPPATAFSDSLMKETPVKLSLVDDSDGVSVWREITVVVTMMERITAGQWSIEGEITGPEASDRDTFEGHINDDTHNRHGEVELSEWDRL